MGKTTVLVSLLAFVILAIISSTSARPAKSQSLSRQKRQSDQRLAELETLLALQKYGRHRFRMDRKKGAGAEGEHPPGYGIIDFRLVGRKKKSIRFSPGEFENSVKEAPLTSEEDRPSHFQENKPNSYWTSKNNNNVSDDKEDDSIAYSEHSPSSSQRRGERERLTPVVDQTEDVDQEEQQAGAVPLFYLQNK